MMDRARKGSALFRLELRSRARLNETCPCRKAKSEDTGDAIFPGLEVGCCVPRAARLGSERVWSVLAERPSDWRFGASELAALCEIDRRPKAWQRSFLIVYV